MHRIRYFGFLGNCHRAQKLALCRKLLAGAGRPGSLRPPLPRRFGLPRVVAGPLPTPSCRRPPPPPLPPSPPPPSPPPPPLPPPPLFPPQPIRPPTTAIALHCRQSLRAHIAIPHLSSSTASPDPKSVRRFPIHLSPDQHAKRMSPKQLPDRMERLVQRQPRGRPNMVKTVRPRLQ